jgi:hypothetical protein
MGSADRDRLAPLFRPASAPHTDSGQFLETSMADYTPYQQKIIKRYYNNYDAIQHQRLSEMVTEIYLAEGKKRDRLWKNVGDTLRKLEFPESRVTHLLSVRDPKLLPGILKELESQRS